MVTETLLKQLSDLRNNLREFKEILLANLVMAGEIPAPTFNEQRRIEFLMNRFTESGLSESSVDDCGNGVGLLKGEKGDRAILINAHADTVFSEKIDHTMQVADGSITGPGVADNSLGLGVLASLPYIFEKLELTFRHDIILLGGVKSLGRGDLEGIRFFLENSPFDIKTGLCIEGIELGRLSYASIGMLRGEITCRVPESYDWSRFGDASAIVTLNEVINKMNDMRLPKRPRTSVVMGSIRGGSSFNTIAREATLGFELRSESEDVVADVGRTIEDIVTEVSSKTGDDVELDIFARRKPGGIPFAHPLTRCARDILEALDVEPRLAPSTSELAAFIDKGIPSLTLGITNGDNLHKENETIDIEPIYTGLAQLIGTLIAIDGGHCD
ncbi:MAG: M20/M25/M40 family metallo-hydrolase [Balneolaceae bacterium]